MYRPLDLTTYSITVRLSSNGHSLPIYFSENGYKQNILDLGVSETELYKTSVLILEETVAFAGVSNRSYIKAATAKKKLYFRMNKFEHVQGEVLVQ